jgi:LCP family protein required for cell wall assembly
VWWSAERALERTSLDAVSDRQYDVPGEELAAVGDTLNVLVVGSDSREGLSAEERQELHTGDFDGAQTDTILLFQVTDEGVSAVSFPRDLKVTVAGETSKINAVLAAHGPDRLVGIVEGALGIDIDHYVQVAIPSFLDIVDAAGGVEICLDEALEDRKSGADFAPGCHDMDGADALAYVRSRAGPRGDFARVERQQTFLRALSDRATSLGVLGRPDVLRSVVTEVADGLTVDEDLSVPRMLALASALRGSLDEGIDATTIPAWPSDEDGVAYVIAYRPGVEGLAEALQGAEPLPAPLSDGPADVTSGSDCGPLAVPSRPRWSRACSSSPGSSRASWVRRRTRSRWTGRSSSTGRASRSRHVVSRSCWGPSRDRSRPGWSLPRAWT